MDGAISERRRSRRWPAGAVPWSRVRLRPGRDAALVDLCEGGALIEGAARLHPGSTVVLQLVGPRRSAFLTGTVVRCQVSALDRDAGVRYRGAISFDVSLNLDPHHPSHGLARRLRVRCAREASSFRRHWSSRRGRIPPTGHRPASVAKAWANTVIVDGATFTVETIDVT